MFEMVQYVIVPWKKKKKHVLIWFNTNTDSIFMGPLVTHFWANPNDYYYIVVVLVLLKILGVGNWFETSSACKDHSSVLFDPLIAQSRYQRAAHGLPTHFQWDFLWGMSAHAHAHADEMQESGRTEDAVVFPHCIRYQLYMGMDQYLLIPFLGGWTSIYQLFWCSPGVQGFDTLPHGYKIL